VHWLREQFPKLVPEDAANLPWQDKLESENAAFALLCEERARNSELYISLLEYFKDNPKLQALERMASEQPEAHQIADPDIAKVLFRNAAYLSPSRVEAYARCAFAYYCNYGLKARTKQPVDFNPLLRGDILHYLFEHVFSQHNVDDLLQQSAEQRSALLNQVLDDYAAEHLTAELPARVIYLYNRLRGIAVQVFERRIDMDQSVKPYEIALPDGGLLRMGGKVDRVDCAEVNGQRYFRVIDYKSGGKGIFAGRYVRRTEPANGGLSLRAVAEPDGAFRRRPARRNSLRASAGSYSQHGGTQPASRKNRTGKTEKQPRGGLHS
jgi:ATP-dependent helicase/nuclease subunit B